MEGAGMLDTVGDIEKVAVVFSVSPGAIRETSRV
jgi:hypothetical protein